MTGDLFDAEMLGMNLRSSCAAAAGAMWNGLKMVKKLPKRVAIEITKYTRGYW